MPTVLVNRERLFAGLGRSYADDEFDELCFEFGIELDEVTSEARLVAKEQGDAAAAGLSEDVLYRIEVPANRYDLLSTEGLVRALRYFTAPDASVLEPPSFSVSPGPLVVAARRDACAVRPFIAMAVLRGVRMTLDVYASLIDVQEKLQAGLGRRRAILSMGTYDLAEVCPGDAPSSFGLESGAKFVEYAVVPRAELSFVPLNRGPGVLDGDALLAMLEADLAIRKYVPLVRGLDALPVLRDGRGSVLSVIPLLNSDLCKVRLETRDILIDVTGTDETKVGIALNMLVTAFASHCERVEAVRTLYLSEGASVERTALGPDLAVREQRVSIAYVNRLTGLSLDAGEMSCLLRRMMLSVARVEPNGGGDADLIVAVPSVRSDVIHACDVMEDVAIAYGINRLPCAVPGTSTIAVPQALNKLSDALRREVALAGWTEVLTFSLVSAAENYAMLRRKDPGNEAVRLANAKSSEFEVVHTTLLPAMLKTLASNKRMALPLRIFQLADVVLQDALGSDVGARNERRLCAAFCGKTSGFEVVHGLLDRVMAMLGVSEWRIEPSEDPAFFPGRQAAVIFRGVPVGVFGIVHPDVSAAFDAPFVCSMLELNIELFL